ncbi:hypothetical protein MKW98_006882, partial [Papaver atlanticum]
MRTLKIREKLCPLPGIPSYHSPRKNGLSVVLFVFGCAVGASIFMLTAIIFTFPWISPSLMNPMLQNNLNLKFSFPYWQLSPSSTITTSNTTIATATASTSFSSARNFSRTRNNETETYHLENSLKNSSAVFVDLPKVRELVVTKPPTSNYSSDSNSILVETLQTNGDDSSDGIGSCDIFDGEWVRDNDKQPYYPPGSCPFVEGQNSACYNNGRPDDQFLKWQWQWQSQQTNARCDSNNIP